MTTPDQLRYVSVHVDDKHIRLEPEIGPDGVVDRFVAMSPALPSGAYVEMELSPAHASGCARVAAPGRACTCGAQQLFESFVVRP